MNLAACEYNGNTLGAGNAPWKWCGGEGMNRSKNNKKQQTGSFLSGVVVLSVSTVLVKIVGLACKIPLIAILGAEGMGYFNSAYEIYALLCVISTAGLPTALAMLIAGARAHEDHARVARVYRSATRLFCLLGGVGTLGMLLLADPIARAIGNADAEACIVAIAPALLCVCIASAVRGYFQGCHRMGPTAISQLIEAVGKLVFGVLFAAVAVKRGYRIPICAAYGVWGLTLGTALSALYLMILKTIDRRQVIRKGETSTQGKGAMRLLLRIALPITVSAAVLSVTRMVDMALILRRLGDVGVSLSEANQIYGAYTTLALPVFSLIPALVTPIALSLVPQLSAAIESRAAEGQARVVTDALRLTVLLGLPSSLGIAVYARPILSLLFAGETEAIAIAAPLLSVLGASVFFSCMITTTNAILQSYRKTEKPIVSTVVGSTVKIIGAYLLIGIPSIGVFGAPISTFLCNLTVTAMNLWYLYACLPHTEGLKIGRIFGRPLAASVGAVLLSVAVYLPMRAWTESETIGFFAALMTAAVGYAALAVLFGAVTREDLALLPHRKKKSGTMCSEQSELHS